ncbi:hypothetical protein GWK47_038313 [Chionoecetes opilio]|uniref:Uncharacterized protein n=1 Tax=Chionoecetes opilio TaxID=41210 RepID=A0A8J5CYB8_CHIOP|nr:hypothetical protein GWK47_038313 [Chionoecetes opilio]
MVRIGVPSYVPQKILDSLRTSFSPPTKIFGRPLKPLSRHFWYLTRSHWCTFRLTPPLSPTTSNCTGAILTIKGAGGNCQRINLPSSQFLGQPPLLRHKKIPPRLFEVLISRNHFLSAKAWEVAGRGNRVGGLPPNEGLRVVNAHRRGWRHPVLKNSVPKRRGNRPVPPPKLWGPIAINSPGPQRLPPPGPSPPK